MSSIKNKFISGVIWESIGRFSSLGIQFAVTILIARILSPSDYGLIGLLTVFIALGQILLDSGFSQALIQKKEATDVDFSSVFFLNFGVGLMLYVILYFVSPLIASFYNLPELTNYARILFLIIPINSCGLIQNVLINKHLQFQKSAVTSIASAVLSGVVGLWAAHQGMGIWALVWQQMSMHTSKTLFNILQKRWVPQWVVSIATLKEMFGFSMNLMFHSLINTTMKDIHTIVIGKFFSTAEVGYYNQAKRFEEISASTIAQIMMKVSFPALVHYKDDLVLLKAAYNKIIAMTVFVVVPIMFLLMAIAEPLFRILLTDKWLPAVPYFQLLCIYGMLLPLLQISYNIYKLFREGKKLLILDSMRHVLLLASIACTIYWGISAMLIGQVVCMIIILIANLYYSGKLINCTVVEQVQNTYGYYLLSSSIAVALYFIPFNGEDSTIIFVQSSLFIISYIGLSLLFRLPATQEVKILLNKVLSKIRK